jgi:CDP-diacylglycerol pyrophosphatase
MPETTPIAATPARARPLLVTLGATLALVLMAIVATLAYWLVVDGRGQLGLRHVVENMCMPADRRLGTPFPCLEVSRSGGWAVLHAPFDGTQILVVPLAPVTGVEDPAIRRPEAPDLWSVAWRERARVASSLGRTLHGDDIVLAINSQSARTQDHYHVHVDCIAPSVRRTLAETGASIGESWREMRLAPWSSPYRLRRIDLATLAAVRPERLIDRELKPSPGDIENLSFAVIGTTQGPSDNPELFLAVTLGLGDIEGGHAEELIDHTCRAE